MLILVLLVAYVEIRLWRNWEEHLADYATKHNKPAATVSGLKRTWTNKIVPRFGPKSELRKKGFVVELIDCTGNSYRKINKWPTM